MMKNTEWGAVAYLSHSKYGIGKEIANNNYNGYMTGCGSAIVVEGQVYSDTCDTYTTANGLQASTTGNITGIYDMVGGAYEYVMGVLNKTASQSGISAWPNEKYYDNYTSTTITSTCNSGICYGHALSETQGWYSDSNTSFNGFYVWFQRGGPYNFTSTAGVFSFSAGGGDAFGSHSFRVVITTS